MRKVIHVYPTWIKYSEAVTLNLGDNHYVKAKISCGTGIYSKEKKKVKKTAKELMDTTHSLVKERIAELEKIYKQEFDIDEVTVEEIKDSWSMEEINE